MENIPGIINIILIFLGGAGGTWLLNLYLAHKNTKMAEKKQDVDSNLATDKQKSDIKISENEQAFKILKELLDSLRKDFAKITDDMTKLEQEHLHCREENAGYKADIRALTRELESVKTQIGMKTTSVASLIDEKKS